MALGVAIALVIVLFDQLLDATVREFELDDALGRDQRRAPAAAGVATASAVRPRRAVAPAGTAAARWALVLGLAPTRLLVIAISFDSIGAILASGLGVGAAVLVVMGGPRCGARPGRAIAAGLAAVGVPLARLEQASVDARGSTPYFAVAADGAALFVKALGAGRAERRPAVPRSTARCSATTSATSDPFSSLRRRSSTRRWSRWPPATPASARRGASRFATAEPDAFVLVYEAIDGRSLDRVDADEVTDDVLGRIWARSRCSAGIASPTATCGWPTSSWPPTARSG